MQPEVGKVYRVVSSRKGTFVARCVRNNGTFSDLLIVMGNASAMLSENRRTVGEEVTVRNELCTFAEVPQ